MGACNECGSRPATICVSMTINGTHLELSLCGECARRRMDEGGITLDMALSELLGADEEESRSHPLIDPDRYHSVCRVCGLTAQELVETELLGCDACYVAHAELIGDVLAAMRCAPDEGPDAATARRGMDACLQVGQLMDELQEAVRKEEYLKAAELRDRIRSLRGEAAQKGAAR